MVSQVPALSSGERGMLDLLTLDRNGRLVVLELKAGEDLHLPVQALDYWIRVRALNDDRKPGPGGRMLSAFERHGYFAGAEVLGAAAAAGTDRPGAADSSRHRDRAALFLAGNRMGTDRAERTLAPRVEGGLPQARAPAPDS